MLLPYLILGTGMCFVLNTPYVYLPFLGPFKLLPDEPPQETYYPTRSRYDSSLGLGCLWLLHHVAKGIVQHSCVVNF